MELMTLANLLIKHAGQQGPLVLLYHSIDKNSRQPAWRWAVSLEAFRRQLDMLRESGYQTILASDMKRYQELPAKSICITFDDGLADNLDAVEALVERQMCASFFIVGGDIGKHTSWLGNSHPAQQMLTAANLREMEAAGMEIGSHSLGHKKLAQEDDQAVAYELSESRKVLSDVLGRNVDVFAYPHGSHNDRVVELTRQAGYRLAFSTVDGFIEPNADLLKIPRVNVFNTDSYSWFARKIAFGVEQVSWKRVATKVPGLISRSAFSGS